MPKNERNRASIAALGQQQGLFPSKERKNLPIASFFPQKNKTHYPHIKPGIYIFVQDKLTKQVFLWNTRSGHGHPLLANWVNDLFHRKLNDFSWVEAAGEMVFGKELFGQCYFTGFFYEKLGLAEPASEEEFAIYAQKIQEKLENSLLPPERYFYLNEWHQQVFNTSNREFFFKINGLFQKQELASIKQFSEQLGLSHSSTPYSEKTKLFFDQILLTLKEITQEDKPHQTSQQQISASSLLATQGLFSAPSSTPTQTPDDASRDLPAPSWRQKKT